MTAIIDCETDSTDPEKAQLKFFGGLDCETGEVTILDYRKNEQIKDYIRKHKILIGFNLRNYDKVVLENFGVSFEFKVLVDLWEALAPRGDNNYGKYNKDRLHDINPSLQLPNYKLKTIIEFLKLDNEGTKGEIDYSIYKKDDWSEEELAENKKYLTQDLNITKKLFDWYKGIFEPLKPNLPKKDYDNYKHLTCTSGCLSYKVICNMVGMKEEYNDSETAKEIKKQSQKIEGGHHIHTKWEKVRGNIICRDFVSHYPTTLIMFNLLPENQKEALAKILSERITAKKNKDKVTALALKVPLNSVYGILGNATFKNIYNPQAGADCTRIGRELLKRYAKTLDVAGFVSIYGFTDSVYCGIPKGLSEEDLELITNMYIETIKKEAPNPTDSFGLGIDKRIKFMWFIEKKDNNYLYVTQDNKIEIKGGLFDIRVPKSITALYENYISPKILKELDVVFSEEELLSELKKILEQDPELSAEEYSVKDVGSYNSKTSLQYQVSERYGPGVHHLIPNTADIGVGKGIRYCSLEEFRQNNLDINSIHIERMMRYLKPFYTTKEEVFDLEQSK